MKKINGGTAFLIGSFVVSLGLAAFFANRMFPIIGAEQPFVVTYAKALNQKAPLKVDAQTRLIQVNAYGPNIVQYIYKLDQIQGYKLNVDSLQQVMTPRLTNAIADLPEYPEFVKNQVQLEYVYKDRAEVKVLSIVIKPTDYTK
ncbi:MAG: hypothetical protein KBS98_08670 [Flavobacterium sp.]|nr:hypothetical protein [Candidatus Neoflavobacterium equi]